MLSLLITARLLYLQLLNNNLSSDDDSQTDGDNSLAQFAAQPLTAEEAALLSGRLLHSEEMQKETKEELSKMRHDCIRREGVEVSCAQPHISSSSCSSTWLFIISGPL